MVRLREEKTLRNMLRQWNAALPAVRVRRLLMANQMNEGHIRIRDWEEYKRLVREKNPRSITFVLEQNGLSPNKELSTLRIIMLHDKRYFMFFDFPKGDKLRETGIPLHGDKNGILNLDEDEVKAFLKKEFEKENVEVFSFWTT
jgi:hypothetical protein